MSEQGVLEAGATDPPSELRSARRRVASPTVGRWVQAVVLAVPALVLAERAWDRRWMTDDGFINLRISRMILDGHGPVFNVGERVEPATSTLWVWIVAAGDLVLPLRMEWVAIVLGLVGAGGGLALATFGSARLFRSRGATGVLVPAGAVVVAAIPPFWEFSTSGLEGGLTFGWLGSDRVAAVPVGGVGRAVRRAGRGRHRRWPRSCGPTWPWRCRSCSAACWLAQWVDDRARDRLRLLALALAVPVAYQVFRMGYYGSLVPNTALAKSGGRGLWRGAGRTCATSRSRTGSSSRWRAWPSAWACRSSCGRGGSATAAAWWRWWRCPLVGLVDALYVMRVGGDYMHGRLLLPGAVRPGRPARRGAGHAARRGVDGSRRQAIEPPARSLRARRGRRRSRRPTSPRADRRRTGCAGRASRWWCASASVRCWCGPPSPGPSCAAAAAGWSTGLFVSEAYDGHVSLHGRHAVTAEDQGWGPEAVRRVLDSGAAVHCRRRCPAPSPATATAGRCTPAGASGWSGTPSASEVYVLDMLGLADPLVSRFELERPGATGHEKPIPAAWLAARVSDGPVPDGLPAGPADECAAVRVAAGRSSAPTPRPPAGRSTAASSSTCRDAVHDRLTPGRFLRNLVEAPGLTSLRVPADPNEAVARFCE